MQFMRKTILAALAALMLFSCAPKKSALTVSGLDPARFDSTYNKLPVALYTMKNASGMEVCVTNFGGRIVSIAVPDRAGKMQDVVLGFDNMFGSRSHNDFDLLPEVAKELGVSLQVDTAVYYGGKEVSSTRIRKALQLGQTDRAAAMLGRGYRMWGTVERGRQLGRTLGFPTANVSLADTSKVWPADGVYAVRVMLEDGTSGLTGMANFGAQPTFGLDKPVFEVNIFDFDGDLYDTTLTVEFGPRLRDICRFDSVELLVAQLNADRDAARRLLQETDYSQ